jgi:prepilin-type N-terminal cleavage/methylation domain-containing protein
MNSLKKAFTLVELLVVITVIGVLVALLVPAIHSAREAARRVDCKQKMRAIYIGLQAYKEKNGHLPRLPFPPWTAEVLPYTEMAYDEVALKQIVVKIMDTNKNTNDRIKAFIQTNVVPSYGFICLSGNNESSAYALNLDADLPRASKQGVFWILQEIPHEVLDQKSQQVLLPAPLEGYVENQLVGDPSYMGKSRNWRSKLSNHNNQLQFIRLDGGVGSYEIGQTQKDVMLNLNN